MPISNLGRFPGWTEGGVQGGALKWLPVNLHKGFQMTISISWAKEISVALAVVAAIATAVFGTRLAEAYPTASMIGPAGDPASTIVLVHNKLYHHCHNKPPRVVCHSADPWSREAEIRRQRRAAKESWHRSDTDRERDGEHAGALDF